MTFAAISDFVVGDDPGMARWLLEHYYEHIQFNDAVQALGYPMPDYPIQTMGNPDLWLNAHQQIHQSIWSAIGGGVATDLSRLEWDNDSMVYDWLQIHASIHGNVRESLGL